LIIGIIEFGRVVMVQQILTNASREGARRAILEGATASDVQTLVGDYLTNASISGGQVSVSPSSLESLGFGNPVTVSVSVPYAQVTWVPASGVFESLHGATLSARTVMRAERPE
jgi:Flp pilus assembly protein TadG